MNKRLPAALLLGLAVTACGTQPDDARPDRTGDYEIDAPEVDQPADDPTYIPEDEWGNWDREEEEWGGNEGNITVLSTLMAGQVGSYLFNDDNARATATSYDQGSEWGYTSIDSRTTISGDETVMVMLNIEGNLLSDALKDGATFSWDSWDESGVFVTAVGCSGTENMWEDFDAPADEVEITVEQDTDNPDILTLEYVATFESWDNPGESLQAKGVSVIDLGN